MVQKIREKTMKYLIFLFILASCASKEQKLNDHINSRVWQCQELCQGRNVSLARIEDLNCLCNQQPQGNYSSPNVNIYNTPAPQYYSSPAPQVQQRSPSSYDYMIQGLQHASETWGGNQTRPLFPNGAMKDSFYGR